MKLNIVFAVNNNGFEMMAIAVYSVIKNNQKHELNIYVFHKDITKENISRLKTFEKKFPNVHIKSVLIDGKRFDNIEVNHKNVTTEAYFRYLAPEVLDGETRALCVDYDMLCIADLDELYGTNLGDNYIGAVPDYIVEHNTDYRKFKRGVGFEEGEEYFNSGLLLLDLEKIRKDKIMDTFWSNLRNKNKLIAKEFNIFADQTVANVTFKGKIKSLNTKYNTLTTALNHIKQKNPVIVHFTGIYKPMTYRNEHTAPYDEMYYGYFRECTDLIGDGDGLLVKFILKKLGKEAEASLKLVELRDKQSSETTQHIQDLNERIKALEATIEHERQSKTMVKNLVLRSLRTAKGAAKGPKGDDK